MAEPETGRERARAHVARRLEDLPRRGELLEQAADASRSGLRTRRERLIQASRPILHTSVAAAGSWLLASEVFGHTSPFFAPIAAVITLGLTVGQRGRRAVELAVGVAVGILIADLLVAAIGTGTWQIAVVTGLAMLGAILVGGGPLLASQAGVSAVIVATIEPPGGDFGIERFVDALTGGGVALVVSGLLFPVNPLALARSGMDPLLARLAAALDEIAAALEARDMDAAERALVVASEVQPEYERLREHLAAAGETARLTPVRRDVRRHLRAYELAAREIGLALANVRVLARGAIRAINLDHNTPDEVSASLRQLAESVRGLGHYLDSDEPPAAVRDTAMEAAGLANSVLEQTGNLSAASHSRPAAPDRSGPHARHRRDASRDAGGRPGRDVQGGPLAEPEVRVALHLGHVHLGLLQLAGVVPVHRLPARELVEHPDARLAAAVARLAVAAEGEVGLGAGGGVVHR